MSFVVLHMIEQGPYDEDTGLTTEVTRPTVVSTACIRCFYARKESKPGTRLTFTDGGGFVVSETPAQVALAVASEEIAAQFPAQAMLAAPETV